MCRLAHTEPSDEAEGRLRIEVQLGGVGVASFILFSQTVKGCRVPVEEGPFGEGARKPEDCFDGQGQTDRVQGMTASGSSSPLAPAWHHQLIRSCFPLVPIAYLINHQRMHRVPHAL